MAEYKISADGARHFILTEGDRALGELTYEKWFSFEAAILLTDTAQFHIKPKGFWGTTIELQQEGVTLLHFNMGWNGNIIIQTIFNKQQQDFVFGQKSFFKNLYTLTDSQNQELLVIQPDFKWKELNYDYTIFATDSFEASAFKEVLLLLTVHCANYYMAMIMMAVV